MKSFVSAVTLSFVSSLGLLTSSHALADEAMAEIQSYCESMVQAGTDEAEAKSIVGSCVEEQRYYLADASEAMPTEESYDTYRYEEEASDNMSEQDCYQVADDAVQAQLEADPDAVIDYENLVNQCLYN